jgi:hypothetical protein
MQIFIGGKFVEPDQSKLTPEAIKQLDAVRTAWNAVQAHEAIVAECQREITAARSAVAAAERLVAPFGKYDFHRLWLETVKGQ